MKKLFFYSILMLGVLFTLSSCNTPEEPETVSPKLNITTGEQLVVSFEEGLVTINYELMNGVEGGEIGLVVPEGVEWISDVKIDAFTLSGIVSFKVSENEDEESRSAILRLVYKYDGEEVSAAINLIQEAVEYDFNMNIKAIECQYWGRPEGLGYHEYVLVFGDEDVTTVTAGAAYYSLTLILSNRTENLLPEQGVYEVAQVGHEGDHTVKTDQWSVYLKVDEAATQYESMLFIEGGELVVEKDGDDYVISGVLVDDRNNTHKIYYKGAIPVRDNSIFSTLKENVDMDLTGYEVNAYYNGNFFGTGSVWNIVMHKEPKKIGDFTWQMQLITHISTDFSTKLGTHTFLPDKESAENKMYAPWTFTLGTSSAINYNGSWVFTFVKQDEETGMWYVGSPAGPFRDGQIDIEKNADGTYNLIINSVDDNNHTIKARGSNLTFNFVDNIRK